MDPPIGGQSHFLKNLQDKNLASDTSATTTLLVGLWKNKATNPAGVDL